MSYLDSFRYWRDSEFFDEETRNELKLLDEKKNKKEIEDRFYKDLEFGTAGLRGVMGVGSNRMNKYTVGKTTVGFANYLMSRYGSDACLTRGVVIAYDTRNNSKYFAGIAADVFSAMGVKVHFCKETSPIPVLSFTVRSLNAVAGVVITASHNPREYNGYKLYDESGCQLVPKVAKDVAVFVNEVSDYSIINFSRNQELIEIVDLTDEFVSEILKESRVSDKQAKENLKVVYTPIHGSGFVPICKALKKDGFVNVSIVEEQAKPNGDFPTVSAPNPERRDALEMGIAKAETVNADIVLGTDPDADRVGIAVKTNQGFKLLNGNQIAALLIDFLISKLDRKNTPKPVIIKTVVSSDLCDEMARKNNILLLSVLTGFKYIGEKMNLFENAIKTGNNNYNYNYLFGFEESYGYLVGGHARDKDAVVASMLLCEVAAEAKANGKTLVDKLNDIYKEYGYYLDAQDTVVLKGKDGLEKMAEMMKILRETQSPFKGTLKVIDYSKPVLQDEGFEELPSSDVLKFILEDGSWVAVRPSGTEPKIKIYYSVKADSENEASKKIKEYQKMIKLKLGL